MDSLANPGAAAVQKIRLERGQNNGVWTPIRGIWDGSKKQGGKTGCGRVITAPDKENWMTVCKIAVPLTTRTAMASEVAGAPVQTQKLDLSLTNNLSRCNIVA